MNCKLNSRKVDICWGFLKENLSHQTDKLLWVVFRSKLHIKLIRQLNFHYILKWGMTTVLSGFNEMSTLVTRSLSGLQRKLFVNVIMVLNRQFGKGRSIPSTPLWNGYWFVNQQITHLPNMTAHIFIKITGWIWGCINRVLFKLNQSCLKSLLPFFFGGWIWVRSAVQHWARAESALGTG